MLFTHTISDLYGTYIQQTKLLFISMGNLNRSDRDQ